MAIIISCPHCRSTAKAVNTFWHKAYRCKQCGKGFAITRERVSHFEHSDKDPPTQYLPCPGCTRLVCAINGACPLCEQPISDSHDLQESHHEDALWRANRRNRVALTLLLTCTFGMVITVAVTSYVKVSTRKRDQGRQELSTTVDSYLAKAKEAANRGDFKLAETIIAEIDKETTRSPFADSYYFPILQERIGRTNLLIRDQKCRDDSRLSISQQNTQEVSVDGRPPNESVVSPSDKPIEKRGVSPHS